MLNGTLQSEFLFLYTEETDDEEEEYIDEEEEGFKKFLGRIDKCMLSTMYMYMYLYIIRIHSLQYMYIVYDLTCMCRAAFRGMVLPLAIFQHKL